MGDISPHFSWRELECSHCGVMQLADGFIEHLEALRRQWGRPLKINSCCRCIAYNTKIGGAKGSFHQMKAASITGVDGCCAADISTAGWSGNDRWEFVRIAMDHGWSIGVAKTFIHVDRRQDKLGSSYHAQPALFTY